MSSATCCGISSMRSIVYHRCNASYIIKAQAIMHADAWWDTVPKGLMISRSCGTGWYTKPAGTPKARQARFGEPLLRLGYKKRTFENKSSFFGAGDVTRTHDLLITNQLHYRLCYTSIWILTTYLLYPILFLLSILFLKKRRTIFVFHVTALDFGANVW